MDMSRARFLGAIARILGTASVLWTLASCGARADGYGWLFPYFSGNNSATQLTQSAPAGAGSTSVPNIGTFADGVGPVAALDGTLYIGNQQGQVMAFTADGQPVWTRTLSGGEPVIGSGMVWNNDFYVVAATETTAALYRFDPSGNEIVRTAFPQHRNGKLKTAAPHITFVPGHAVIVVPVAYEAPPVYETRLLLFAEDGGVAADHQIDVLTPTTTGGFGSATIGGRDVVLPFPTVATWTDTTDGQSYVVVADGYQSLVVYTTKLLGFTEVKRWRNTDRMRSFIITPAIQIGGQNHAIVIAFHWGGYLAADLNGSNEYRTKDYLGYTMPVLTTSAAFSVFEDELWINDPTNTRKVRLPGKSIVPAAASQTYVYISTDNALLTFRRAPEYEQVSRFDWVGGGRNPPIVGPKGHVYAMASNILFIFPPPKALAPREGITVLTPGSQLGAPPDQKPRKPSLGTTKQVQGQTFGTSSPQQPPQPASTLLPTQLYDPPLTANGNRLFACEELDQDDCGKGDHNEVSLAWCQGHGYPKVSGYDVDSRKVKAETLDGRFCSRNKCKVFEQIVCANN